MAVLRNTLNANPQPASLSLSAVLGVPGTVGQTVTIGTEDMTVTSGLGTIQLQVERGANGTSIAAHAVGATVTLNTVADIPGRPDITLVLGASGNLIITGLPTADPEEDGAVWLDSGVLTISAGS